MLLCLRVVDVQCTPVRLPADTPDHATGLPRRVYLIDNSHLSPVIRASLQDSLARGTSPLLDQPVAASLDPEEAVFREVAASGDPDTPFEEVLHIDEALRDRLIPALGGSGALVERMTIRWIPVWLQSFTFAGHPCQLCMHATSGEFHSDCPVDGASGVTSRAMRARARWILVPAVVGLLGAMTDPSLRPDGLLAYLTGWSSVVLLCLGLTEHFIARIRRHDAGTRRRRLEAHRKADGHAPDLVGAPRRGGERLRRLWVGTMWAIGLVAIGGIALAVLPRHSPRLHAGRESIASTTRADRDGSMRIPPLQPAGCSPRSTDAHNEDPRHRPGIRSAWTIPATATAATQLIVPVTALAGPWDQERNPNMPYAHDAGPPVVVPLGTHGLAPGTAIELTCVGGQTNEGGLPDTGCDGLDCFAPDTGSFHVGCGTRPIGHYVDPDGTPLYGGQVIAAFADATGRVLGKPFVVRRTARTVTVPAAAERLQFGIDDCIFSDNSSRPLFVRLVHPDPNSRQPAPNAN
jgi:hypothetical protein